jgi:hypothetical protein
MLVACEGDGLLAVLGREDVEAFALEVAGHDVHERALVVDDERARAGHWDAGGHPSATKDPCHQ